MGHCKLVVRDAVNVRFEGLDVSVRKKMVEALKFFIPEARHMPQFKLGRWDGTVAYCTPTGGTYLNLLDRILPILEAEGIAIEVDDQRPDYDFRLPEPTETMFAAKVWPVGHPLAGQAIMLRDYQANALRLFIENLQSVQNIATGAGKTLLTAAMSSMVEPYGRSIVIVPSKSLVTQTEEDYRNLGLDVGVFFGDRKEWNRTHTICTWQSLSVFAKRSKDLPIPITKFIEGVVCVIVDEAHQGKATELRSLLCGPMAHIPIRWGVTGTIPKAEHEALALTAGIGPVVGAIRAKTLQDRGVLANCQIKIIQTKDDDLEFSSYEDEHEYLVTDRTRLRWLAAFVSKVSDSGNTLVLVDRIETGEALKALVPGSVFVSGGTKAKARKKEYDEVQSVDGKVIIATYGVAAVGLNIPRLFNCVLVQPGKSFTRVIQSIGRILRKTSDKTDAIVYDITSNLKFAKRHMNKRKEYYKEAEYPFAVQTGVSYRLD